MPDRHRMPVAPLMGMGVDRLWWPSIITSIITGSTMTAIDATIEIIAITAIATTVGMIIVAIARCATISVFRIVTDS